MQVTSLRRLRVFSGAFPFRRKRWLAALTKEAGRAKIPFSQETRCSMLKRSLQG